VLPPELANLGLEEVQLKMNSFFSLVGYFFKNNIYGHQSICFFNLIKFKEIDIVKFCDVCGCMPCDCDWGN
jgi:hypothetical protein